MKNKLRKLVCFTLSAMLACGILCSLTACGAPRSELLRVYVPGEYMDPAVYEQFSEWYFDKTGKNIEVRETTFDSNESMLLKIEKSKADYDLVCPSEYMVEKMISLDLVKPVDKSVIDITEIGENGEPLIKQTYLDIVAKFDPEYTYTVPYVYGTFGIMYDYSKTQMHLDSWEYMFFEDDKTLAPKFSHMLTQKESVREMYASACIYAARKELSELSNGFTNYTKAFSDKIQSIYEDTSEETIAEAKRLLANQKKYVLKYEVEDGKFGLAGGTLRAAGGLYWSCDAGYVMGDYEDENGEVLSGNKNLWYSIPKEGGNVYIDSFVIPKYAGNETAANLFMQYLCECDVAVQNSYYVGAVSPVSEAYNALYEEYSTNDEMFEGTAPAENGYPSWKDMYLDMLFPSAETLARCGIMRNFASNNSKINRMFADIVG